MWFSKTTGVFWNNSKLFKAFNDRIWNYEARHINCLQSLGASSGLAEVFERKEEKTDDKKEEEK